MERLVLSIQSLHPGKPPETIVVVTDQAFVRRVLTIITSWLEQEGRYDLAMTKRLTND